MNWHPFVPTAIHDSPATPLHPTIVPHHGAQQRGLGSAHNVIGAGEGGQSSGRVGALHQQAASGAGGLGSDKHRAGGGNVDQAVKLIGLQEWEFEKQGC